MQPFIDSYPLGSGRAAFAPLPSDSVAQLALGVNVQQRVAIPTGARFAQISHNGEAWFLFGTSSVAAAIGSAGTTGANAALCPSLRRVPSGATHISIISASGGAASLEFWS